MWWGTTRARTPAGEAARRTVPPPVRNPISGTGCAPGGARFPSGRTAVDFTLSYRTHSKLGGSCGRGAEAFLRGRPLRGLAHRLGAADGDHREAPCLCRVLVADRESRRTPACRGNRQCPAGRRGGVTCAQAGPSPCGGCVRWTGVRSGPSCETTPAGQHGGVTCAGHDSCFSTDPPTGSSKARPSKESKARPSTATAAAASANTSTRSPGSPRSSPRPSTVSV